MKKTRVVTTTLLAFSLALPAYSATAAIPSKPVVKKTVVKKPTVKKTVTRKPAVKKPVAKKVNAPTGPSSGKAPAIDPKILQAYSDWKALHAKASPKALPTKPLMTAESKLIVALNSYLALPANSGSQKIVKAYASLQGAYFDALGSAGSAKDALGQMLRNQSNAKLDPAQVQAAYDAASAALDDANQKVQDLTDAIAASPNDASLQSQLDAAETVATTANDAFAKASDALNALSESPDQIASDVASAQAAFDAASKILAKAKADLDGTSELVSNDALAKLYISAMSAIMSEAFPDSPTPIDYDLLGQCRMGQVEQGWDCTAN